MRSCAPNSPAPLPIPPSLPSRLSALGWLLRVRQDANGLYRDRRRRDVLHLRCQKGCPAFRAVVGDKRFDGLNGLLADSAVWLVVLHGRTMAARTGNS